LSGPERAGERRTEAVSVFFADIFTEKIVRESNKMALEKRKEGERGGEMRGARGEEPA